MVKCEHCGHQNQLGHLFCMRCGARLGLKARLDTEMLKGPVFSRRCGLKCVVVAVLAAILLLAGMMFWPVSIVSCNTSSADYANACKKLRVLTTIPAAGPQVFTEQEVNAYMLAMLSRMPKVLRSGPMASRINSVVLSFKSGRVIVKVDRTLNPLVLGPVKLGPVNSSFELRCVPESGEGGFGLRLRSGKMGFLPLPGGFCRPLFEEMRAFFANSDKEIAFLDRVDAMEVADEKITVSIKRQYGKE